MTIRDAQTWRHRRMAPVDGRRRLRQQRWYVPVQRTRRRTDCHPYRRAGEQHIQQTGGSANRRVFGRVRAMYAHSATSYTHVQRSTYCPFCAPRCNDIASAALRRLRAPQRGWIRTSTFSNPTYSNATRAIKRTLLSTYDDGLPCLCRRG